MACFLTVLIQVKMTPVSKKGLRCFMTNDAGMGCVSPVVRSARDQFLDILLALQWRQRLVGSMLFAAFFSFAVRGK